MTKGFLFVTKGNVTWETNPPTPQKAETVSRHSETSAGGLILIPAQQHCNSGGVPALRAREPVARSSPHKTHHFNLTDAFISQNERLVELLTLPQIPKTHIFNSACV